MISLSNIILLVAHKENTNAIKSTRVVLLLDKQHDKLCDSIKDELRKIERKIERRSLIMRNKRDNYSVQVKQSVSRLC